MHSQIQPIPKNCFKCNWEGETAETACPRCGKLLRSKSTIRVLGGVLIFLGGFLTVVPAVLTVVVMNVIANSDKPGSTTKFTGSDTNMFFMFAIFAVVFMFGLASLAAGFWQLIFGRRNKILVWIVLGLAALFLIAAYAVRWLD